MRPRIFFGLIFGVLAFLAVINNANAALVGKTPIKSLNDGLIGYWTFDGVDVTDKIYDRSCGATCTTGNNGGLIGVATSSARAVGKIGQALKFDGIDDYASTTPPSAAGLTAFSYSFWIKLSKTNPTANSMVSWGSGTKRCKIYTNNTVACSVIDSNTNMAAGTVRVNDGKWHHIIFTSTDVAQNLYVDGVLDGTGTQALSTNSSYFRIGANSYASVASFFDGLIDDVRIYNRVLTSSEIKILKNLGTGGLTNVGSKTTPVNLTSGLVGYWTFDGKDVNTSVVDSSGNGNNGYFVGGATSSAGVVGKIGQALKFDGVDNVVNIPNSSALDSIEGSSAATVSFWIKNNNQAGYFITRYDGTLGRSFTISGSSFFSLISAWRYGGSGAAGSVVTINCNSATCPIPLNKWTHVVATYNDPTSSIYINGAFKTSSDGVGGVLNTGVTAPIKIGADALASVYANATIDDVRIYNRALSATEVKALYNTTAGGRTNVSQTSTSTPLSNGLVGHWTFDGKDTNWATGVTLDKSGHGNSGQLTNMATRTSSVVGKIGQALKFDGLNDYVNMGNTVDQDTNNLTISVWVRKTTSSNLDVILGKADNVTPIASAGFRLWTSLGNDIRFTAHDGVDTDSFIYSPSPPISNGEWNHMVISWVKGSDPLFYWNGVLTACFSSCTSSQFPVIDSLSNANNFVIGARSSGGAYFNNGSIDDVRIYNRALSATEIKQLYNMGR